MPLDRTSTPDFTLGAYRGAGGPIPAGSLTAFSSATGTGVPFWIAAFNDLAWLTHGAAVQVRGHQQWVKNFHNGLTKLWVAVIRFRFEKAVNPTGWVPQNITTVAAADVSALLAGIGSGDQLVSADLAAAPLSLAIDTAEDATYFHWYSVGLVGYGPARPAANEPAVYVLANDAATGGGIGRALRRTNAAITDQLPDFSVYDMHQTYHQGGAYARTVLRTAARKLWTRPSQLLGTTPQGWNLPVPIGASRPHMCLLINGFGFGTATVDAAIHLRKIADDGSRPSLGSINVAVNAAPQPDTHSVSFGPAGGQGTLVTTKYGDNRQYQMVGNFRNTGKADLLVNCETVGLQGPPAPVAATLTTRTSDTNARFTFAQTPHGLALGGVFDVLWAGGARLNCRSAAGGDGVTTLLIRDGSGDAFPALNTEVTIRGDGGFSNPTGTGQTGAASADHRHRSIHALNNGRSAGPADGYAVPVPSSAFLAFVATVNSLATTEVSWGWEPIVNTIDSQVGGPTSEARIGHLANWYDSPSYDPALAPAAAPALRQIIRAAIGGSLLLSDGNYKTGLASRYQHSAPGYGDLCELYGALLLVHGGTNDAAQKMAAAVAPDGSSAVLNAVLADAVGRGNAALVIGCLPQVTAWSPLTTDPEVIAALRSYNAAFLRSCARYPAGVRWVDPFDRFWSNITAAAASWYAGGGDFVHLSTTAAVVREYGLWLLANLAAATAPEEGGPSPLLKFAMLRQGGRR